MGRRRSKEEEPRKKGIGGYYRQARAIRWVSDGEGGKVKQVMACNFGCTENVSGVGDSYHANGEADDVEGGRPFRVTIYGPKHEVVNLMFQAAIRRIGFKIVKGV